MIASQLLVRRHRTCGRLRERRQQGGGLPHLAGREPDDEAEPTTRSAAPRGPDPGGRSQRTITPARGPDQSQPRGASPGADDPRPHPGADGEDGVRRRPGRAVPRACSTTTPRSIPAPASTSTTCSTDPESPAMTVVVDHDAEAAQTLAAAIGGDCALLTGPRPGAASPGGAPRETVVVLGVTVDTQAAFHFAEAIRIQNPALGVILVRRRLDTSVLAEALRSGVREVVTDRELSALADAVRRANDVGRQIRQQVEGARRRRRGRPPRSRRHGLLRQGRLRQDHHRHQPRRRPRRPGPPRGLPGRPRPGVRRRRHRAPALPGAHHRRRGPAGRLARRDRARRRSSRRTPPA